MARVQLYDVGGRNVCAFLDMLAVSEIGDIMLSLSDDGYDVLVGSLPNAMRRFTDYRTHPLPPGNAIEYKPGHWSTAAGRYQILSRYWPYYRDLLGLTDFGPINQDRYAIQQFKEQRALPLIRRGDFVLAVERCRNIWASLPGAGYGQYENSLEALAAAYVGAGGAFPTNDARWFGQLDPPDIIHS